MSRIIFLLILAFFAYIALGFPLMRSHDSGHTPMELITPVSARMDTAIVDRGVVKTVVQHEGITRVRSAALSFGNISHRFGAFYVIEGDIVVEGQLLARLDTENLLRQISEQESLIERLIHEHYFDNRARELEIELLSLDGADRRWAVLALSQAQDRQALTLRHARERLEELQNNVELHELQAPFDGVVTFITDRQYGQWIGPLEPIIFISTQDVFIEYMGNENLPLRRSVRIQGHLDGRVYDLESLPFTWEERAFYTAQGINMPIRFTADSNDLTPGSHAFIMIYTVWHENALRLPINALFLDPDANHYVYVITDGLMEPTRVRIGDITDTFAVILDGLYKGDEVFVRP